MDEGRQGLGGEDGQDAPVSPLIDGAAGGSNAPTPHPRTPQDTRPSTRRSPVLVILRVLVAVLAVVAVLATGAGWVTLNWFRHSANTTDVLSELDQQPGAPPADDGADDILLIGDDSRTDAQGNPLPEDVLKALRTTANPGVNTDTIILLRIPKHGGKAYAISIPRDTYVSIPGIGYNKINAAFELTRVKAAHQLRANGVTDARTISQRSQRAGRKALVSTVQKLTGARVDHYAEINLYGFYLLSRAIGGVDVCLRAPAHDKDSGADFPSGPQT
ncbi:MAG: LCP family protein, partial [Sciscionella sp.]